MNTATAERVKDSNSYIQRIHKWYKSLQEKRELARLDAVLEMHLEVPSGTSQEQCVNQLYGAIVIAQLIGYRYRLVQLPEQSTDGQTCYTSYWRGRKLESRREWKIRVKDASEKQHDSGEDNLFVPEELSYQHWKYPFYYMY